MYTQGMRTMKGITNGIFVLCEFDFPVGKIEAHGTSSGETAVKY
jgi:hypothetical protein